MPTAPYLLGSKAAKPTTATDTLTLTVSATTATGDVLVLGCTNQTSGLTLTQVTDSQGNNWTVQSGTADNTNETTTIATCTVAAGKNLTNGVDTISAKWGASNTNTHNMIVMGQAGAAGTPIDVKKGSHGTGASSSTSTGTLGTATETVFAFVSVPNAGGAMTWQSPMTDSGAGNIQTGANMRSAMAYDQVTSSAAISPNATWGTSANWSQSIITIKLSAGLSGSASFTWTISRSTVTITSPTAGQTLTNLLNDAVSFPVVATDSDATLSLSYSSTGLPTGLSISSTTGIISGTCTAAGSFTPSVTVTDSGGSTATVNFNWNVGTSVVTVTNPGPQSSTVNLAITPLQVVATDSDPAATFTYAATNLPAGLALSSGGLITGTPTTADTYPVTVTVTDSHSSTGTAAFMWSVLPPSANLVIAITPKAGVDQFGNPYPAGLTLGPAGSNPKNPVSQSQAIIDLAGNAHFVTASGSNIIRINPTQKRVMLYLDPAQAGNLALALAAAAGADQYGNAYAAGLTIFNGVITAGQPGSSPNVVETWHNLSLVAGWSAGLDENSNTYTPAYRIMPDGSLALRGIVITPGSGSVLNTDFISTALPAGYRNTFANPPHATVCNDSGGQTGTVYVSSGGKLRLNGAFGFNIHVILDCVLRRT